MKILFHGFFKYYTVFLDHLAHWIVRGVANIVLELIRIRLVRRIR